MKNGNFRLLALGVLASLVFGVGTLWASIDPNPELRLSDLEIPHDVFPVPEALKDNVVFWRRVFAEWRLNQVVLHDADYPALIYEIIELQGKTRESFSADQTEQIKRHREALEKRLSHLAMVGNDIAGLSSEDRTLRQKIIDMAGKSAIADAAERVRAQRGLRERFLRGLEISGRYDRAFRQVFREEGVPEDLAYLPHVESSFQNRARSSAGAAGMWQFTRSAGRLFMTVNRAVDQRMDPVAAARGAARYLRQAYEMLGNWPMAVTSYNHGIKGMLRAKAEYGSDFNRIVQDYDSRTFGFASRNFYAEFLAVREIARDHERYFPKGIARERPLALDSVVLDKPMRSSKIARLYDVKRNTLVALNPAWTRRAARGRINIPGGTEVWLPAGTLSRADGVSEQASTAAEPSNGIMPVSFSLQRGESREGSVPAPVRIYHIVRRNESLSVIAEHYGLSIRTLRALNDIPAGRNLIYVGQKLRVRDVTEPKMGEESDTIVHVVRKGDNLSMIASDYGIAVKDLLDANQLTRRSIIRPGQRLDIPVGR